MHFQYLIIRTAPPCNLLHGNRNAELAMIKNENAEKDKSLFWTRVNKYCFFIFYIYFHSPMVCEGVPVTKNPAHPYFINNRHSPLSKIIKNDKKRFISF